ncbi:MAG: glycoside hydrolase [Clostridia bacterium]|nr:glycoside hydrolase [Clostridia bacterium]
MKKLTFGTPEKYVPSLFCQDFRYEEKSIKYPVDKISFRENARGCVLELPVEKEEHFFGLGLQLKGFDLTGRKYILRVNSDPIAETGDSHAPVPFFVSSKGYGIFIDTARYAEINFGKIYVKGAKQQLKTREIATSTEELYTLSELTDGSVITVQIPAAKGVDVYIMEGETVTDVVSQYNMLSGGGCNPPEWGLGTIYRCCTRYSQDRVLSTARYFKENRLPVSVIGLEPGWQTKTYSCSYVWNNELYPEPKEMVESLYADGYHVNLWEHVFTHPSSPIYKELLSYCGNYEVWNGLVPDFSFAEAKEIFARYHRENVTFGLIDGFKLDECDDSDYQRNWSFPLCSEFPSGMDGEQYHSLIGTLYMQTMLSVSGDTLSSVRNAGALGASYPFVLYSDLYDHRDFVRGLATAGFSGILWTPELRHAGSREELLRRLQTVVFSPQCLINAWYCEELPWLNYDCEDEVRELLCERVKLIPRLKKAFENYKKKGIPPVRAVVSDYTSDAETYGIDDEYLLGDDLLVAPIISGESRRSVYLPQGEWSDYWTGKPVQCGRFDVETEKIPVYVKNGR